MAYPLHRHTPGVTNSPDLPALERETLAYWRADGTFRTSVEDRPAGERGANEFVFYDGPPFANGLPHYGHLLTGYVKDVVPRYRTMQGRRVERRFGWDCHGLPAELEAERELGIKDKLEIDALGVEAFNAACRSSVLKYTDAWEEYVTRQARWVDFEHDYKTLDLDYMESVIWAFKTLWEKGLVYEGHRVLWYCFRCGTPLSASETRLDDVYRQRQDPAVTVAFKLETGEEALAWTTTPWTLPSNLALAVHPEVDYVSVEVGSDGDRVVIAEARLGAYARELGEQPTIVRRMKGSELVGLKYTPLLDFFADRTDAFRVLGADYVTTEDGTGIVHIAPAFGEEDKAVTDEAGIQLVNPVGPDGRFTDEVPLLAGLTVFAANKPVIAELKRTGRLLRQETYDHPYPHCWRCDTPLIQRAVSSWFIEVSAMRDRMVELGEQIRWVPEHIKDGQFGKWLAGARDWSISRNRYWGSPIPVWKSDDPAYPRVDVYGSLDEIERDFGVRPTDLHRPFVDDLTRPNPDDPTGASTMRRVPEVLDCWFDSGSMPFAQVHFPFENRQWFEDHYPGDFIVEYIGQTRGWFYTLHVLATALFDRPAFSCCVAHGIVLGSDGTKMSKSRRNYPDVSEVFERDGSDAMRWFLMSSSILRGGNLIVTEEGIRDAVRHVLLPLWNTWSFFALYANAAAGGAGITVKGAPGAQIEGATELDRYILARTRDLVIHVTEAMDAVDIPGACEAVRDHLDVLTNWYVRRSRDRFWEEDSAAFQTLYTALEVLARVIAPLAPLTAEEMWRGLTGGRSVHLTSWPEVTGDGPDRLPEAPELVATMDQVRDICSAALSQRKARSLRVRQPLRSLTALVADPAALEPFASLIADEVNVRTVDLSPITDDAASDLGIEARLEVNARAAGPRLGRGVQAVIKAAKAGDWREEDGNVIVGTTDGDVVLLEGEYKTTTAIAGAGDRAVAVLAGGGFVVLDTALDEDLIAEGYARDTIRLVQDARKAADLAVSDRIALDLTVPARWLAAVEAHTDLIAAETLALRLEVHPSQSQDPQIHLTRITEADS
ncbi:MAG: isoleucine--tRNA ligase [Bifidobacteriaceae bacterium]|jgi:isoleucyl-tRNA synthetase|nr:isoleucine--tRNA ligase [Bifidobacteriaceae bacterium]